MLKHLPPSWSHLVLFHQTRGLRQGSGLSALLPLLFLLDTAGLDLALFRCYSLMISLCSHSATMIKTDRERIMKMIKSKGLIMHPGKSEVIGRKHDLGLTITKGEKVQPLETKNRTRVLGGC